MTTTITAVPRADRLTGQHVSLGGATAAIARRTLIKFVRTPQLIVVGTIQGAMFLLIFRYVFGGAIGTGPVSYVDFLVPGFVTTTVLFVGMGTAAGVAEDLEQGFVDRLRSLPVPRSSILAGRALADTALLVYNLAITVAIGFAVGFRLGGSVVEGIGAFALCMVFGFAFTWLFVTIGLIAGKAQAAQGMSLLIFPLTFVSSAYVPVRSMPGWLQAFANHQPITVRRRPCAVPRKQYESGARPSGEPLRDSGARLVCRSVRGVNSAGRHSLPTDLISLLNDLLVGPNPPFHHPVFAVTNHPWCRSSWRPERLPFFTDSIESACNRSADAHNPSGCPGVLIGPVWQMTRRRGGTDVRSGLG